MNITKKRNGVVIGYGGMGGWHTRYLKESDAVNLLGVYDIKPERNALAEENGIHAYHSWQEVLADANVDFVTLAVPNELHKPLAIEAMAAGKHVISEKPVTMSSADLQEMLDASNQYGRLFTVHQNRRWDIDYLMMKHMYESGDLGKVFTVESRYHGSRGIPGDWRGEKEHGGGMIYDWGVHLIDQMIGIVNDQKIEKVYCRCDHLTNDEVDDGFKMDLFFERDLIAHIEVSTRNFIALPRFFMAGMDGTAIINDWRDKTKVVLCKTWEENDVKPVVTAAGLTKTMAPRDDKTTVTYEVERPESDVHNFYRNFVCAMNGEAKQLITHNQVMRVMKIMEAAFESDRVGAPIAIDDVGPIDPQ